MTDFRSDNVLGCSPEIAQALLAAGEGAMSAYGADALTQRVREQCSALFETDCEIYPMLSGTAANALGIAAMTPPWGAVFCHDEAHIQRDEMGAVEFYTSGAKLVAIPGAGGRIQPQDLARTIDDVGRTRRMAVPACVSLTNVTEAGSVYTAAETAALASIATERGVGVHLDGARFANAVAATGDSPADLTWRAGVDVMTFGGTKNGLLGAELIVLFRKELREELALRIHRSGHRLSKMRLLSSQFAAYLSDDLWLRNARHANAMAHRIRDAVAGRLEIVRPVDANIIFIRIPRPIAETLTRDGFLFYDMPLYGKDVYRIVTGFDTREEDVEGLVTRLLA